MSPERAQVSASSARDLGVVFPGLGGRLKVFEGGVKITGSLQASAHPEGQVGLMGDILLRRQGPIVLEGKGKGKALEGIPAGLIVPGQLGRKGLEGPAIGHDKFAPLEGILHGVYALEPLAPEVRALEGVEHLGVLVVHRQGPIQKVGRRC